MLSSLYSGKGNLGDWVLGYGKDYRAKESLCSCNERI